MIFGINIILWLGVINFILILIQLLSGLRVLKMNFKLHKRLGITLFITASIHGTLAILVNYI
jgi:hypothetical protein